MKLSRRHWLARAGALSSLGVSGPWHALAAAVVAPTPPLGPLGAPDVHGVRVAQGFRARLLATSGRRVDGTDHPWHAAPDGGATFAHPDGGWVYVSNAEVVDGGGGAGALRFDRSGAVVGAYTILSGTHRNCAGGPTPWGTWLSCEEVEEGLVYECDPARPGQGLARPLLGTFMHEAAAVDPASGFVYLTEDAMDSRLYRFRPERRGDLSAGVLEAAGVQPDGRLAWRHAASSGPCRAPETTAFARAEGAWFHAGVLYFTTTADHRVWAYTPATARLTTVYDAAALGARGLLRDPDNLTVHAPSGALLVAEDAGALQVVMLIARPDGVALAPLVQFVGHDGSEVTGPAFSPDGTHLYVSSQRGRDGEHGMTFEITGPFASP
ncbi:MAG: alkaline phosphatase PhoX [Gammaproteobacteria bacterium]